jgi:hypothetical protein
VASVSGEKAAVLAVQINLWVATIRGRGGLGDASGATIVVVGILSIVPLKIAPSSIGRFKRTAASDPSFTTYGPRSDAEYQAFLEAHGGTPL